MLFKKIQSKDTLKITNWFLNSKEVTQKEFEKKDHLLTLACKNYNSSLTKRNEKGDFIHTYTLN